MVFKMLTESPPLAGGRNLTGGTRIESKKNIEGPATLPDVLRCWL